MDDKNGDYHEKPKLGKFGGWPDISIVNSILSLINDCESEIARIETTHQLLLGDNYEKAKLDNLLCLSLIEDFDDRVRSAALQIYGKYWATPEQYAKLCETRLTADYGECAPIIAINALSRFYFNKKPSHIGRLFFQILCDEQRTDKTRKFAYIGLLDLNGVRPSERMAYHEIILNQNINYFELEIMVDSWW